MLRFLPPIEEKGFSNTDSFKFHANPNRQYVFRGKTFIFLTESKVIFRWAFKIYSEFERLNLLRNFQHQRFNFLLSLTNAKSFCIANCLSSNRRCFYDIFQPIADPCLIFETEGTILEHEIAYSVLNKEFNRRPILEQEVALAIIDGSCEIYCNASCPCPISDDERHLSFPADYLQWDKKSDVISGNPKRRR